MITALPSVHGPARESSKRPLARSVMPKPGVRIRSTLAATGVVAVALALGAAALLWILSHSLSRSVQASAEQRASDVAAQVSADNLNIDKFLPRNLSERSVVQVIAPNGNVLVSSPEIDGEAALTSMRPAPGVVTSATASVPVDEQEPFKIVARGVHTTKGDVIVIAAQSLASVEQSVQTVEMLLLTGFPLLLLVVAGSVYFVVGRTLGPVEAIRRRVASITLSDLGQRVPVPTGNDEVSRLASTMNQMLERLQQAQIAQRRFVADASHELRSPLAALRTTLEVVRQHPDTTSWQDTTAGVLQDTDRLDHLVDDLLMLARTDETGLTFERHDVDLDDILAAERDRLRRIANVRVRTQIAPARVMGDRRQLERLVRNLCDNAARYATSTVVLELSTSRHEAIIIVADDGPGIAAEDRQRVFERFVRLDPARDRTSGGSGLGLAIVYEVVRAHHGSVTLEDADTGARFIVRLPLTAHQR